MYVCQRVCRLLKILHYISIDVSNFYYYFILGSGSPKGTLKNTQRCSSPYKNSPSYTQKQAFPDDSRRASSSVSQVRRIILV